MFLQKFLEFALPVWWVGEKVHGDMSASAASASRVPVTSCAKVFRRECNIQHMKWDQSATPCATNAFCVSVWNEGIIPSQEIGCLTLLSLVSCFKMERIKSITGSKRLLPLYVQKVLDKSKEIWNILLSRKKCHIAVLMCRKGEVICKTKCVICRHSSKWP